MKKFKHLGVFLLLITIISISFPQQIFAAKTKYVLVSEEGSRTLEDDVEFFSPDDTDINFEKSGSLIPYSYNLKYNEKGQLINAEIKSAIGRKKCVKTLTYTYDQNGRLIQKNLTERFEGTVDFVYTYEYNNKNQLIQITKTGANNDVSMTIKYKYYSNGNIKSCTLDDSRSHDRKWTFYSNGIIKSYTTSECGNIYKYDSHGNLKEERWDSGQEKGKIIYKNIYKKGTLVKSTGTYYINGKKGLTEKNFYYTDGVLKGKLKENHNYLPSGEEVSIRYDKYKLDSSGKRIIKRRHYGISTYGKNKGKILQDHTIKYKWKKITIE